MKKDDTNRPGVLIQALIGDNNSGTNFFSNSHAANNSNLKDVLSSVLKQIGMSETIPNDKEKRDLDGSKAKEKCGNSPQITLHAENITNITNYGNGDIMPAEKENIILREENKSLKQLVKALKEEIKLLKSISN